MKEIRAITDDNTAALQTNLDATYEFTEKGIVKNRIHAARLDQYGGEKPYVEATGGLQMTFFDSAFVEVASLSSDAGTFYQKEKTMIAWGNVVLGNTKGEKLETSRLVYEQDSARISSDQFVKITSGYGVFYGKGLIANENFTEYKILQPTGDIYFEESQSPLSK